MARVSSFKNMVITLTSICLVSSTLLALVYAFTKDPIAAAETAKKNSAIAEVVPEFDNAPVDEKFDIDLGGSSYAVYPAKKGDQPVGYAIESYTTKGFGGRIILMVGFDSEGKIINTSVVSHSETPGLGEKIQASKSDFSLQFREKNPAEFNMSVKQDGGDVDAITASTISSRAFCDAMQTAYKVFKAIKEAENE